MRKPFDFLFVLFLFTILACQNNPASNAEATATADTPNAEASPKAPSSSGTKPEPVEVGDILSQPASIKSIERKADGENELYIYRASETELKIGEASSTELSALEAHIAQIISVGAFRCATTSPKNLSFVIVNGAGNLHGVMEFPCSYTRRITRLIGMAEATEYSVQANGNTEKLNTPQLNIHSNNLTDFRQIVKGLQFSDYGKIKIGSAVK